MTLTLEFLPQQPQRESVEFGWINTRVKKLSFLKRLQTLKATTLSVQSSLPAFLPVSRPVKGSYELHTYWRFINYFYRMLMLIKWCWVWWMECFTGCTHRCWSVTSCVFVTRQTGSYELHTYWRFINYFYRMLMLIKWCWVWWMECFTGCTHRCWSVTSCVFVTDKQEAMNCTHTEDSLITSTECSCW